ncbi:MAG: hypothetical protein BIFFINMI_00927 [Phycisphaerae bacterium]|nr:hypothetical protein [Phycisphaerae bacterium]
MVDLPRLKRTLGVPELAWVLQAIRRQYERGNTALAGAVSLPRPTQAQRDAVDRLLGRKPTSGKTLAVRLDQLDQLIVHARLAETLQEAVEALAGPLVNRHAIRGRSDAQWASLFEDAHDRLVDDPLRRSWLDSIRGGGLLRRLSGGDLGTASALMNRAIAVVNRLPEQGILLARLAAEITGDSHALDAGSPLGSLAIRAAALLAGEEQWSTAEARRRVWDAVGVVCDEFSAPVLVLNLCGDQKSLTGRALSLFAEHGEPCRLTAGLLIRHPWNLPPQSPAKTVYVCENPSILAAAARSLGRRSWPMVCIDGQPSTAAHLLLSALSRAGIELRYHGDFDWGGIRIANLVMRRYGAIPWRMAARDYLAATCEGGARLKGSQVAASWDGTLTEAMAGRRIAVHEEQVSSLLIEDLGCCR